MKTNVLIIFAIALTSAGWSATYQTIANGSWGDPAIWSTDGGVTSCGCVPPNPLVGEQVYVYHDVNMSQHIGIAGGSYLYVAPAASLLPSAGGTIYNLTTWGNSTLDLYGSCTFQKLINGLSGGTNGSTINVYGTLEVTARIQLFAGTTNVIGGYAYLPSGNFDNYENSDFNILDGAKLELFGGNISNMGDMFICDACCAETAGNWQNAVTGVVGGSGSSQTSGGNMTNDGSFSTTMTWCSAGFDAGMPSTEDCLTTNTTCGIVQLPVVLASFYGVNKGDYNTIVWITATERDSDYFVLERSEDGVNWYQIAVTPGAGNKETETMYEIEDQGINDVYYYRLEQFDYNGDSYKSYPISVSYVNPSEELTIYPNPATGEDLIHISGLDTEGQIYVYDMSGSLMLSEFVTLSKHNTELNIGNLGSGMYTLVFTDKTGESKRSRFVIR